MSNILSEMLEKMGLTSYRRPVSILFSDQLLNDKLYLQYFEASQSINKDFLKATALCFSTDSTIALKKFIGVQVAVDQICDSGQYFRTTGVIVAAEQGASDGALTSYLLTIEDPLSILDKRINNRIFIDKSVIYVVDTIIKEWYQRSSMFMFYLRLNLEGLKKTYPAHAQITQRNESDKQFILRLLAEHGINAMLQEQTPYVDSFSTALQPLKLCLIDHNAYFKQLDRKTIRFHRSSAAETQDSITHFSAKRSMQPTQVHGHRWRADLIKQEDFLQTSKHHHSDHYANEKSGLDTALEIKPACIADLEGHSATPQANLSQLETTVENQINQYNLLAKVFIAKSTVRDAAIGQWFQLEGHELIDHHKDDDNRYLIFAKKFYCQNNIPKQLNDHFNHLLKQSQWTHFISDTLGERQENELVLHRKNTVIVPEYNALTDKPRATMMHCKVVGPSNEVIHVDELGRIKVRFPFLIKPKDNQHDGGSGTNDHDNDSAWVPVLNAFAGTNFGERYLPRIGEIVLVSHLDADIDRPIVIGRVYEATRYPAKFDHKGKLPETRYLSGVKTAEIEGNGFSQLRFDDTQGQISAQLHNSFAASQINLGQLSFPKEDESSKDRGTGFEIRTDSYGAVRAGNGLLITSYAQTNANGEHMYAEEAKQQISKSYEYAKSLSEVAKQHQTDEITTVEQLKSFAENIQKDIAKFNRAMLLLSSPSGIGLSTAENIHLSSDQDINQIAKGNLHASTQKNFVAHAIEKISLFAVKQGMKLIAAHGKTEIHAQTDAMDIIADKVLKIISKKKSVEIAADQEISLNVKGNYIKLTPDHIELGTQGEIKAYTKQFIKYGPKTIDYAIPKDPYDEMHILKDSGGNPISGFAYKIVTATGQIFRGISNEKGETIRLGSGYQGDQFEVHTDDGEDFDDSNAEDSNDLEEGQSSDTFDNTNSNENEE